MEIVLKKGRAARLFPSTGRVMSAIDDDDGILHAPPPPPIVRCYIPVKIYIYNTFNVLVRSVKRGDPQPARRGAKTQDRVFLCLK